MQETTKYAPGTFCWVELGTTDSAAAKKFYTELFGWDFTDSPVGPSMVYTMLKQDGKDVGALYELPQEMRSQGVGSHWLSYISTDSADETAKKAKELGATLLKEPFDVMTVGRMAVVQDPAGACFAIWQPGEHAGAGVCNTPNSFCWNELGTNDTKRAGDFYANLLGWSKQEMQFGPMEYTMFNNGERPAGGMYALPPEMASFPPNWMVYFAVEDADATVTKAESLGATTFAPPSDIPGIGRFAILQDPTKAVFAIIKLENSPS
jgi:predicted enzyme related to lactoylglutathione lyase